VGPTSVSGPMGGESFYHSAGKNSRKIYVGGAGQKVLSPLMGGRLKRHHSSLVDVLLGWSGEEAGGPEKEEKTVWGLRGFCNFRAMAS